MEESEGKSMNQETGGQSNGAHDRLAAASVRLG